MISIIILTKNEEKNILDCLESVSWADEIIVIDDFSQDRTEEVIKNSEYKDKVNIYKNKLGNDFASQRNFGLSKATKDWVLFIDADERVSKQLREEINTVLIENKNTPEFDAFFIPRRDYMWGKLLNHGEVGSIKLLRLGRRGFGAWVGEVHEEWMIDGKISELENYIIHYPHQTISEFLTEINFYSSIRANELFKNNVKTSIFQIIFYPKAKFAQNFVLRLGFLDGLEGFLFAMLMSLHSFLVRGKLWLLWQKK